MSQPTKRLGDYVTRSDAGTWRLTGTRTSLDSVVINFQQGNSAEIIRCSFPTLTLEQVYGAITFYLANKDEVEAYLLRQRAVYEEGRARSERNNAALHARLRGPTFGSRHLFGTLSHLSVSFGLRQLR